MKETRLSVVALLIMYLSSFAIGKKVPKDFYSLKAKYIQSYDHRAVIGGYAMKVVKFEKYRGKVLLIVNTASECVYADSHYRQLVKTYNTINNLRLDSWEIETPGIEEPDDSYFRILGFPCDQFGNHLEAAVEEAIDIFTRYKYGVLFPMFEKVRCVGEDAHPVWKFITSKANRKPNWNFYKYLVDHTGTVVRAYPYSTSVDSIYDTIVKYVDAAKKFDMELKEKQQKAEIQDES